MLELIMKKLEITEEDTLNTAAVKGIALGTLEAMVFVGALQTIKHICSKKK